MLADTLTGMDEAINPQPCRYGPQVHNNDLHARGRRLIGSTGHTECTFVLLLGHTC